MDEFLLEDIKKSFLMIPAWRQTCWSWKLPKVWWMHNPIRMITVLREIKKLGVHIAIDDFGTATHLCSD